MIVTKNIEGMTDQNKFFEERVPNKFARVHVMAKDIKARISEEYQQQLQALYEAEKKKFREKYGKL